MMSTEELLIRLLNHLAERLKDRFVLKGGMLLRLLESPRYTQDLDFAVLSKESKKTVLKEIAAILRAIPTIEITRQQLNSRSIFIDVEDRSGPTKAVLEINVVPSLHLPPEPLSTAKISNLYSLSGRVVRVMAPAESFSNKIAAALERGVGRDFYDLSLFEPLTAFDETSLLNRLSHLEIDRAKPKKISIKTAAELLQKRLNNLSEQRLKEEIGPLVPREYQPGLLLMIRSSVSRLIQRLEILGNPAKFHNRGETK
ncbi:MAG TPA: hypothetical protein DF383_07125 [Deltaproteobacteria bacterium]|nr:hypothetical protein [Deltaproteobacteria bacterium]